MLGTQCWVLMLTQVWEWGSTGVSPPQVASMNQRRVDFYLASIEDMLVAIRRGVRLRRTVTNDRSAPRIL